jgi:hypothetical protein
LPGIFRQQQARSGPRFMFSIISGSVQGRNGTRIAPRISAKLLMSVWDPAPPAAHGFLPNAGGYSASIRGVAQSGSAPGSGPGGRRFESSRPDHSSKRALLAIMSKGFLYVGETLTASPRALHPSALTFEPAPVPPVDWLRSSTTQCSASRRPPPEPDRSAGRSLLP